MTPAQPFAASAFDARRGAGVSACHRDTTSLCRDEDFLEQLQ